MKLSFCQLFLFLLTIINFFQYQNCFKLRKSKENNYKQLYKATQQVVSSLLSPVCSQILFNQNNIQSKYISTKGLSGRVLPAGTFPNTVLALEYLYGLLCEFQNFPSRPSTIQSIDIARITYDPEYFITQVQLIVHVHDNKKLTLFAKRLKAIQTICEVTQTFCNGTLQQYSSVNDCIQYLTTQVPFGSLDRGDQGNVACRTIHALFVPLLPFVHCPHVGPYGGGACTDKTIDFYYNQSDFLGCAHKQY
ncbi:unnamed protein product [Rotaria sp. Silwood2]|nr:unnamed protein product [Rotaria sp. Silwood2]